MKYTNGKGHEYWFENISLNEVAVRGDLRGWRFTGFPNHKLDKSNLISAGAIGGPLISYGSKVDGRKVRRIRYENDEVIIEVENYVENG